MAVRAHDVAAELRERLPGLPTKKLHKLLYYCQGHHLAATGQPLFQESLSAWDMGPVVGQLWHKERDDVPIAGRTRLTEQQLNTIGYVVSRYGQLSGLDLEHLTHSEAPWQLADRERKPGDSVRIELDWIREYFRHSTVEDSDEAGALDRQIVADWLAPAQSRRLEPLSEDSADALRARLTDAPQA